MMRTVVKRSAAIAGALVSIPTIASAVYAFNEYRNTPEDQISMHHTMYSIYYQSITNLFMSKLGSSAIRQFNIDCKDAKSNESLLLKLLDRCKDTMYGKDHNFGSIKSREEFRRKHPITIHEHYQSYIDRVYEGEQNIMFPDKPRMIATTSGTSGSHKQIPVPPIQRKVFFTKGIAITFDALQNGVKHPTNKSLKWPNFQKSCKLMIEPQFTYTSSNIMVGPSSSRPKDNKSLLKLYTTPEAAFDVQSENELLFLHALYALLDKNLGFVEANFCNRILNFFVVLDDKWDALVEAIEKGQIPNDLEIDGDVRDQLNKMLKPNLERAQELKRIRKEHSDVIQNSIGAKEDKGPKPSLARKIWPNLHTILASETGTFQIYGKKLRQQYIGEDIAIYSPLYAATEGLVGVNPDVNKKTFVLHPQGMFYEFFPIDESKDDDSIDSEKTLFIEQLEPGKEYEVIITNLTGLYRYRFGDVVRCVGYHHKAPIVEVAYRKGQFLNASGERTSEETFYKALSNTASNDWGVTLKEYTTVEYFLRGNRKPRYIVFVELGEEGGRNQPAERVLTKKEKLQLDKALGEENKTYEVLRNVGRLEPIEVITVQNGTFEKLRQEMISNGVGATQIKQPRVLRNEKLIRILEENTVS
jgi:hypothetical protein